MRTRAVPVAIDDLDLDPAASCVATFRGQVNNYLNQPDITIWQASYGSALFWTYLMEQYGLTARYEWTRFLDAVTDGELDRYFEVI